MPLLARHRDSRARETAFGSDSQRESTYDLNFNPRVRLHPAGFSGYRGQLQSVGDREAHAVRQRQRVRADPKLSGPFSIGSGYIDHFESQRPQQKAHLVWIASMLTNLLKNLRPAGGGNESAVQKALDLGSSRFLLWPGQHGGGVEKSAQTPSASALASSLRSSRSSEDVLTDTPLKIACSRRSMAKRGTKTCAGCERE